MKEYLRFLWRCSRLAFVGDWRYTAWLGALTLVALLGLNAFAKQYVVGLAVTGLTDHVSWGLYIANFTFLVGMAVAAAALVIPVYVYRNRELGDLVIFAQLFAVASVIMALLFVVVDLGQPDRFHHMFLRFNFPVSMLTWDVLALNGYLLLNLHICGYLIYCAYRRREPSKAFFVPFVFVAIVWAISVQLVEAFLFVGLGGRPFWNSAIIAPRFLMSAFAAGPAFLILALQLIDRFTSYTVAEKALLTLRRIATVALTLGLFMLVAEIFTELYAGSTHSASMKYLLFGLHGYEALVPWTWTAITLQVLAFLVLCTPLAGRRSGANVACAFIVVGIWIEKGMGMIVPAFIPSPLGEIVEYVPTSGEILVCAGIWAFGLLVFTILVRVTVPVLTGRLTHDSDYDPNHQPLSNSAAAESPSTPPAKG